MSILSRKKNLVRCENLRDSVNVFWMTSVYYTNLTMCLFFHSFLHWHNISVSNFYNFFMIATYSVLYRNINKKCYLFTVYMSWKVKQSGPDFPICHCHGAAPKCATLRCGPNVGPPVCCHPVGLRSGDWTQAPPQLSHYHTNSKAGRDNKKINGINKQDFVIFTFYFGRWQDANCSEHSN